MIKRPHQLLHCRRGKTLMFVTAGFCPLPRKYRQIHMVILGKRVIHHIGYAGIRILLSARFFSTQRNHPIQNP